MSRPSEAETEIDRRVIVGTLAYGPLGAQPVWALLHHALFEFAHAVAEAWSPPRSRTIDAFVGLPGRWWLVAAYVVQDKYQKFIWRPPEHELLLDITDGARTLAKEYDGHADLIVQALDAIAAGTERFKP